MLGKRGQIAAFHRRPRGLSERSFLLSPCGVYCHEANHLTCLVNDPVIVFSCRRGTAKDRNARGCGSGLHGAGTSAGKCVEDRTSLVGQAPGTGTGCLWPVDHPIRCVHRCGGLARPQQQRGHQELPADGGGNHQVLKFSNDGTFIYQIGKAGVTGGSNDTNGSPNGTPLLGQPADMDAIMVIARKHKLVVIEDAAHAHAASYQGRPAGSLGHLSSFSFQSSKNLSSGEGGMLVTDDDALAEQFHLLRSHGMTSLTWDRHQGHAWSYDVVAVGYNYRIDEIRSALGREQLRKLPANNARRRELTALYRDLLAELCPALSVPFQDHPGVSAGHIMPVLLPRGADRLRFMEGMKARGIQTSIHYPPVHTFTSFKDNAIGADRLPLTDEVAAREVTLPLYPTLTDAQLRLVVEAARDALQA